MVHYLYNLSLNPLLYPDYGKNLPSELYAKTIKNPKG